MTAIFDLIAVPLGYVLKWIYQLLGNRYLLAIFVFTFLMRLVLFPISWKNQKQQAQRIRLAPRLERLQKKYGNDRNKLAEKTQALYEKEGVSMTAGCLPMLLQMVILLGVISTIYKPLTHLTGIPKEVITSSISAVTLENYEKVEGADVSHKVKENDLKGYYGELRMMGVMEENHNDIVDKISADTGYAAQAEEYYGEMLAIRDQMKSGNVSLLDNPWTSTGEKTGFAAINWLWLIPLFSALTAMGASLLTLQYSKQTQPKDAPGQGCSNYGLLLFMPIFSGVIAFIVPAGVGVYWIFSNVIGAVQTLILNKMYDPAKIRAQAEIEDEERRRQRAEDKKRLAAIHREENAAAEAEAAAAREAAREAEREARRKKKAEEAAENGGDDAADNGEEEE